MEPWDTCSPRLRPTRDPWSLQSVAPMFPPLLQPRLRLQKQLPVPTTIRATHTMSTCPRASLRHLPTIPQKTRRLSRLVRLPASHPHGSFLPVPVGLAASALGGQGEPCSFPRLMINSNQKLAFWEGWDPSLWRSALASHAISALPCSHHLWGSPQEHGVSRGPFLLSFPRRDSPATSSITVQPPQSGSNSTLSLVSSMRPAMCLSCLSHQGWLTTLLLVCAWPWRATVLTDRPPTFHSGPAPSHVHSRYPVFGHSLAVISDFRGFTTFQGLGGIGARPLQPGKKAPLLSASDSGNWFPT